MSDAIGEALRKRYMPPEWALLFEVANGTGRHHRRWADAIAMSLFPSRGLDLHGIEIKEDRGDWLREKKDPAKAEEIAAYCDYWWLVTSSDDIAKLEELPRPWGLLILHGRELRMKKKADRLTPKVMDRPFLAGILRRAYESVEGVLESAEHLKAAEERGRRRAEESAKTDIEIADRHLKKIERQMREFEEKSGLKLREWDAGNIGEAVRELMSIHQKRDRSEDLAQAADQFEAAAKMLRESARVTKSLYERMAAKEAQRG